MGSVRIRPDTGRLFFEFRFNGHRCREQTALPDTPANRRKMEQVLDRIEGDITLGQFDYLQYFPNSRKGQELQKQTLVAAARIANGVPLGTSNDAPLLSEFAELWLAENKIRWRRSTYEMQVGLINKHIVPRLGDRPIDGICRADVLGFRSELASLPGPNGRDSLSAKTLNEIVGTLKAILDEAADRYGFKSPTERIQRLKVQKQDIEPFRLEEVNLIIEKVRPDYRNYMVVRFLTGMRSGEIHGLKWKHIDFERRQILIRETFSKGRTEYTKTDGSQREIHMCQQVYDALKGQHEATGEMGEYVFCNRSSRPIDNKNFTDRVWYPLLRYLDLKKRRPYQTRHTTATLWLASGEAPEWIARQMGHTTTEMLFRVYSRFVPNLTRNDGSAFDRLLQQQFGGVES